MRGSAGSAVSDGDDEAGIQPRDDASPDWNRQDSAGSRSGMDRLGANQAGSRRVAEMPDFGPEHLIEEINSEEPSI